MHKAHCLRSEYAEFQNLSGRISDWLSVPIPMYSARKVYASLFQQSFINLHKTNLNLYPKKSFHVAKSHNISITPSFPLIMFLIIKLLRGKNLKEQEFFWQFCPLPLMTKVHQFMIEQLFLQPPYARKQGTPGVCSCQKFSSSVVLLKRIRIGHD